MSEFDWVEARSNCTVDKVFAQLAEDVQRDLERHNALNPGLAQCQNFHQCNERRFYVERARTHRVVFDRKDGRIVIVRWAFMGDATPLMALAVRLGDDGSCVLINEEGEAWQPWQVRRKALEETLFG